MKTLLIFSALVVLQLASTSPVATPGRPQRHEILLTMKRPPSVKGQDNSIRRTFEDNPPPQIARGLRKGEYVCGDRVCQLQPGEVPPGCNGVCQYRV